MTLLDHPIQLIIMLFCLSLLPLFAVMGTSFLKLAIVFSMLRNALGIQQIPPNMAIYGLALILTLFTMAPVGMAINDNLKATPIVFDAPNVFEQINTEAIAPYRAFLEKNTSNTQIEFFANIGHKVWPEKYQQVLTKDSLLVMVPAFTMSQLIEAFKIGLLIYLPFVAIDLIVSNILLAMGMMMVSPMTIALPFKLLIFILMGGWEKLISQLMMSFS
ncbi:type III secretion system export apparatus subunit SctR [Shewanella sp. NKUCC05_KAH]|jgi:type III secretion protein R|uniref:Yop virulence translocation R n=2 Tax=Shewanella TaxID=22 RepID=A9L228_SHEB9|nr:MULTISPECIES: type III secretion system export apparatus subunit SctR [Shewanella]MBP7662484.1 type III secretion system export apparatus subunit SctR [Shewanella sp.]ABX49446.1 Yop virulence translocation R [Shewanella baltica OS195]ADT94443.1 Yop virulence translocation R [Shewanella baltica OS678]MBW3517285.1 type III secretion system export apparatus subunit SctR [Shewanella sp. NKUCC01_JLK]MBW3528051.1 type III secretion system export apparatus subunit SctR [Shewanella sp. NKUCC05_KAH]